MTRHDMIERIGNAYMTSNIEGGEYSYIQEAGSRANLENALGRSISHFKLDIRFEKDDTVVLVETKQSFKKSDEAQLNEYLQQERVLHYGKKIIAILANTNNDDIKVWKSSVDAKPIGIPEKYKKDWGKAKDGKEDPTKGLVFIHYLSDVIAEMNKERENNGEQRKTVKLAVLLPVSAAIGTSTIIENEKIEMLKNNTLEAVFTLPNEIFYPGASASACCMLFTLGKPHKKADGTVNETFFGYCKEDGFKKKKNLGRIEQFDENNNSKWKVIEEEWLYLFNNKKAIDGKSATATIDGKSEWLCEAYMKTDYSKLSEEDFQKALNNYLAYLMKEGRIYEA